MSRLGVEDLDGGIRVLTLRNPARRNALDPELLEELARAVDPSSTAHIRALLVRGEGGAFCSGYDLGALPSPRDGRLPDDRLGEVLALLAAHPAPSVACVDGPAFGAGCELACTCDFRVGSGASVFCMPPAKLGIVYAAEGLAKVKAVVGLPRAKRMFFTGMRVDAQSAVGWGLLDELHPDGAAAFDAALALCREIARNAPLAVSGMKRSFELLGRVQLGAEERDALRELRKTAFLSEDAAEGRAAFKEKREPRFSGR